MSRSHLVLRIALGSNFLLSNHTPDISLSIANTALLFAGDDIPIMTGASIARQASLVPECSGTETRLAECLRTPRDDRDCFPVFVDCSTQRDDGEKTVAEKTEGNTENSKEESFDEEDDTSGVNGGETNSVSVGLGAILGMAAVTLFMTALVVVSGIVVLCLWCPQKRKRRVVQQITSHSEPHSLHIVTNHP